MSFPRYSEYEESGVEWLGEVPAHWTMKYLKYCCEVIPSNVDKKSHPDEQPVQICNYTDVYYNNRITSDQKFMRATARKEEAEKFQLKVNDVVITKDSETADDIAVPAIVSEDIPGVLCGYHLAIIRAKKNAIGAFLNYLFQSKFLRYYFEITARGLTRVGLSESAIGSSEIAWPSVSEQERIAAFLDHETARIDALIDEQKRLIELLKEKRQAVISHAVTKGLDPDVPMKESGVEWLGDVPEHWNVGSLKHALEAVADVDHYMPASVDSGIPYVMTGDLCRLVSEIQLSLCKQIAREDFLKLTRKIRTSKGDVIMARYATIGSVSYVDIDAEFVVSYSCVTIRPQPKLATGLYLFSYFQSDAFIQGISNMINANTQENVGIADLREVKVALPDIHEQEEIVQYIELKLSDIDRITKNSTATIRLLQERRSALISAAVTGKIDVRNWQASAEAEVESYAMAAEPQEAYEANSS